MNLMLDTALMYAQKGYRIVPCNAQDRKYKGRLYEAKSPRIKNWQNLGTTDDRQIRAWWGKWPDSMIGCLTGAPLGEFVLDIDLPDGPANLAALESKYGKLPETKAQQTGSGGQQLFFRMPEGIDFKNSANGIAKNLDIRTTGGQVILPPSLHPSGSTYKWLNDLPAAPAPTWLIYLISKPESGTRTTPKARPATPKTHTGGTSEYGRQAMESECNMVAMTPEGGRNDALNEAAFTLGRLVAGGEIDQAVCEAALFDAAARCALSEAEARKTIHSGLTKGMKDPRSAPPRNHQESGTNGTQKNHCYTSFDEPDTDLDDYAPRPWPVLDKAAIPGIVGNFIDLATRESEADPAAILATFLTRFGAECFVNEPRKGPVFYVGQTKHRPRLFCAVIGASGKSRKGTSAAPVSALFDFEESDHGLYDPARCLNASLSTAEGLAYAVRDEQRLWQSDKKTGDGKWIIADPGIEDKRLFILDEEFATGLRCTKREGNTLSMGIRNLWDSGCYQSLVKNNPASTANSHICLVSHCTFQELKQELDAVQHWSGFTNRFLWICARRQKLVPHPRPMPDDELRPLQREVLALVKRGLSFGVMYRDQAAEDMWSAIYPELSADHPGMAGVAINRGEAQTVRLAMVYALLDGCAIIAPRHLESALAFWRYCEQSALFIFGTREADPRCPKNNGSASRRSQDRHRDKQKPWWSCGQGKAQNRA